MADATDVSMTEPEPVLDGGSVAESGCGSAEELGGSAGDDIENMAPNPHGTVQGGPTPAPLSEAPAVESMAVGSAEETVVNQPELAPSTGVENMAVELPSAAELIRRLVILCIGGEGLPQTSSGRVPGLKATNKLIQLVISTVNDLFKERKEEVRWVTPLAQLDKMDAYAYLLADLLRGELLLEEANAIGKRAHKHVTTDVPKKEKELWAQAKSDRSNARAKAKKDAALAACINDTITGIDARRDAAIVALWEATYDGLSLPAENTVIVTSRVQPPSEEMQLVTMLNERIAEADATEQHLRQRLDELTVHYDGATAKFKRLMAQKMPEFKARWPSELREKMEAWKDERRAAHRMTRGISELREEAADDLEVAVEIGNEARQRLWALQAAQEERVRESNEQVRALRERIGQLELANASARARVAAHEAAVAAEAYDDGAEVSEDESAEDEQLRVRLERAATRVRLTSDAKCAWGEERRAPQASSAGRVFKLSGASAEDVRAISSEVSQEVTSAEEHAERARRERERDQYVTEGVAVPVAATVAVPVQQW